MLAADNPFFAKAIANRVWSAFFGKGIVDPVDDFRLSNPPSNPALMEAYIAMGETAENVATQYGVSRAEEENLAFVSQQKAAAAQAAPPADTPTSSAGTVDVRSRENQRSRDRESR